jgi:hypothetical protein
MGEECLNREESKRFFFEKRSKKLLVLSLGRDDARGSGPKVFCRAFFQKSAYLLAPFLSGT